MALSMFLRTPACLNPVIRNSVARMASQPSIMQRMASSNLPASSMLRKDTDALVKAVKSTPILNSVRSLRTSAPVSTFPKDEVGHDHARLWVVERLVSAALVPLIPAALMFPNCYLDSAVAVLITAHTFWGLEAIAVDYVRPSVVGPVLPKLAIAFVYLLCIATLGGLFYLISHDVGIGRAVRQIWAVKADSQQQA